MFSNPFKSKTRRYVDTQVTRVIDDEYLPTPFKTAVFESVLGNNTDITTAIKNAVLNGPGRNFERMYRYAKRGDYYYGLPNLNILSTAEGVQVARSVIQNKVERRSVNFEYIYFRPINFFHKAWEYIFSNLGFDPETNELRTLIPDYDDPKEKEGRYLKKIVAIYQAESEGDIDPDNLGVWGKGARTNVSFIPGFHELFSSDQPTDSELSEAANPYKFEYRVGANETNSVEIHYVEEEKTVTKNSDGEITDVETNLVNKVIIVDLSQYDPTDYFYQAKYYFTRNNKIVWRYWSYQAGNGQYPELDEVYDVNQNPSESSYFPFVIFRSEQEDVTKDDGSERFKSTKKLLDFINIDYEELGEALHDEENEDIEDIRQAVMMMAVPMQTDHKIEIEYLFEFFKDIEQEISNKYPNHDQTTIDGMFNRPDDNPDNLYSLEMSDADFNFVITLEGIKKRYVTIDTPIDGLFSNTENEDDPRILNFSNEDFQYLTPSKSRILRKQLIAPTNSKPGIAEEIIIDNPVFRTVVKTRNDGKDVYEVEGGVDDERLLIPLNFDICRRIGMVKRQELYYRSLHFVFNSYQEQRQRWYQRGAFKWALVVVAVAIAWVTGGWGAKLSAAIVAGGTTAAIATIILQFAINFIITSMALEYAFTFVVDQIGIEIAIWFAVAATIIGGSKLISHVSQGIEGSAQTAMNYLTAASGLHSGISANIAGEMKNLHAEFLAFQEEAKEKQEELDDLARELISPVNIDPLYFVRRSEPLTVFGEPPDAYYERTVHSGNVGVRTLESIERFVDMSLTLPRTPNIGV